MPQAGLAGRTPGLSPAQGRVCGLRFSPSLGSYTLTTSLWGLGRTVGAVPVPFSVWSQGSVQEKSREVEEPSGTLHTPSSV